MYSELALERRIAARFGSNFDLHHTIALELPAGRNLRATVFLNTKKQLYVYIEGEFKLRLGDVQKLVHKLGFKAEAYLPPKTHPTYFDDYGQSQFRATFPGRPAGNSADIRYYRTLAPYNPALVQISEITSGEIFQFDSDAATGWRPAVKFAYRRIRTS